MHELGIASAVIEGVRTELKGHPGTRPRRLGLRVGEWSGVDAESLRFCLEVLVRDTELAGTLLDIESCPRQNRCPGCGLAFRVVDYDECCPSCGAAGTLRCGGTELELAFIELEQT